MTNNIHSASQIVISQPSVGTSPSGFKRLHVEMLPKEVGRLIGYDPRVLIMKPKGKGRGSRDLVPHNVSSEIVGLQNQVQRSIDAARVATMVDYLMGAMERNEFADWGSIELVTVAQPDLSQLFEAHTVSMDADADYFIADGQHRYCALLDFIREYPEYSDRFTQSVTISILPAEKLMKWAGQEFHDRNYFSVPVRAGKALSVDTRDPINALAKALAEHPSIVKGGGIAYERDALLTGDPRFASHALMHRFVKGFLLGRPGLDKSQDQRIEITDEAKADLGEYLQALAAILPWDANKPDRDAFLTRASVVLSGLAVVGHDLYHADPPYRKEELVKRMTRLSKLDWRRSNLSLVGVVGSEKNGLVQPASSRQAIDSTIRYLREKMDLRREV